MNESPQLVTVQGEPFIGSSVQNQMWIGRDTSLVMKWRGETFALQQFNHTVADCHRVSVSSQNFGIAIKVDGGFEVKFCKAKPFIFKGDVCGTVQFYMEIFCIVAKSGCFGVMDWVVIDSHKKVPFLGKFLRN